MSQVWYDNFPLARQIFEEASECLKINFTRLCFEDPKKQLNLTNYTQPALLLNAHVVSQLLKTEHGLQFDVGTGHSVGEYGACLLGEVFDFSTGLQLLQKRGDFMMNAVAPGTTAMAALIGCNHQQAQKLCTWAMQESQTAPLECANINSPMQIVLSGNITCLNWLQKNFAKTLPEVSKKRLVPLATSGAFHSSLMKPAEIAMKKYLHPLNLKDSCVPIIQNVDAVARQNAVEIKQALVQQISRPVLWEKCCLKLKEQKVNCAIETGPKNVLQGLMKKFHPEISVLSMNSLEDFKNASTFHKKVLDSTQNSKRN